MFLLGVISAVATLLGGRRQGLLFAALAAVEIIVVQLLPMTPSSLIVSGPMTFGNVRLGPPLVAIVLFLGLALISEELKARTLAELREATEQARRARDVRTEFVANITHELRTPLAGIIGLSDMMLEQPCDAEVRRNLETMRRSADALLHVISGVLEFSQLEVGRLDIASDPFSPTQVAQDVVLLLQPAAQRAGLGLQLQIPQPLPSALVGDALRIRQVLLNLIGNALKFTREGGVTVELRTSPTPGASFGLHVLVHDTGPGLSEGDLERIFEPFEQVDSSSRRKQGGTGLGLPITRRLVELMGGTLDVESQVGVGSTFQFTLVLPLHQGSLPRRNSGGFAPAAGLRDRFASEIYASSEFGLAPAAPETGHIEAPAKPHLVVAEDQDINQIIIRHMLEGLDVAHVLVDNGVDAVDAALKPGVVAVLMDLQMPRLDGIDATRAIRAASARGTSLPIVALTASGVPEIRDDCLSVGIHHVLQKPIDRQTLIDVLSEVAPDVLPAASVAAGSSGQRP
jgi:signal transduction histidine kinase/ActR/RegA family two-component response regulator